MREGELLLAFESAGGKASTPAPELELQLRAYVRAARQEWPDFGVSDAEFVAYLAPRVSAAELEAARHAADLMLACACARGVERAVEAFHQHYGPVMDRVLMHRGAQADVADDVRQLVRERLLVGGPGPERLPKISAYNGAGPLKSWVATTAATTLLTLRRSARRRREQAEGSSPAADRRHGDPELEYIRQRYKAELEAAIIHALSGLEARDRTLLRLHLVERMSIDALGARYSINRATAARWLAAARSALASAVRDTLRARLHASDSEYDSLVALVKADLDVSLARRLAEP